MKNLYLITLLSCAVIGCSKFIENCQRSGRDLSDGNPQKTTLASDGSIPSECVQLKTLPYQEQWLRCFGGKAYYNIELSLSKKSFVCPYGPVSRGMDHDLENYSAYVRIPLDRTRQCVMWMSDVVYERSNDRTAVVLLTIGNMQDARRRFVLVEEIPSDEWMDVMNMKLEEKESVVLFNGKGIYIRSAGDEKFRGYLFDTKSHEEP